MFSDLLKILKLVTDSVKDISSLKKTADRKAALLEMLKTYFLLFDAINDGYELLKVANNDPINYIKGLDSQAAKSHASVLDKVLRRQSVRLYEVQQYISSQSYLAVINPEAQKKINEIIGYKMDRVVNLHNLGASLFFRNILPIDQKLETTASLALQVLTKQEEGLIDGDAVKEELSKLSEGLGEFRNMINTFMNREELINLSEQARNETNIAS